MTPDSTFGIIAAAAVTACTCAVIIGIALVHCARLLSTVLHDAATDWRKSWFEAQLLVEERRTHTAIVTAEMSNTSLTAPQPPLPDRLTVLSEQAMLSLLQTNGGFPATDNNDVGRQVVRELRKMYAELSSATPEPATTRPPTAASTGLTEDELASMFGADDDLEPDHPTDKADEGFVRPDNEEDVQ